MPTSKVNRILEKRNIDETREQDNVEITVLCVNELVGGGRIKRGRTGILHKEIITEILNQ